MGDSIEKLATLRKGEMVVSLSAFKAAIEKKPVATESPNAELDAMTDEELQAIADNPKDPRATAAKEILASRQDAPPQ